jgi:hypothetical protein
MELRNEEMFNIVGGATSSSITSSWINAVARLISTVLDIGKTIGSAIYRAQNKNYCR